MARVRTVIMTLEIETTAAIADLKSKRYWGEVIRAAAQADIYGTVDMTVRQVTATVAQPKGPSEVDLV